MPANKRNDVDGQQEIDWTLRKQKLALIDWLCKVASAKKSRPLKRLADLVGAIDGLARDNATWTGTLFQLAGIAGYSERTAERAVDDATASVDERGKWLGLKIPADSPPIIEVEDRGRAYIADPHRRDGEGRRRNGRHFPREFEPVFEFRIYWSELADRVRNLDPTGWHGQPVWLAGAASLVGTGNQSGGDTSYMRSKRKKAQAAAGGDEFWNDFLAEDDHEPT